MGSFQLEQEGLTLHGQAVAEVVTTPVFLFFFLNCNLVRWKRKTGVFNWRIEGLSFKGLEFTFFLNVMFPFSFPRSSCTSKCPGSCITSSVWNHTALWCRFAHRPLFSSSCCLLVPLSIRLSNGVELTNSDYFFLFKYIVWMGFQSLLIKLCRAGFRMTVQVSATM